MTPDLPQWLDPSDVPVVTYPIVPPYVTDWDSANVVAESAPRAQAAAANLAALASGTLYLVGGLVVPAGATVRSISFHSGTTALAAGVNQWFCVIDRLTLTPLGVSVDDGATAWAGNSLKTLLLQALWTPAVQTDVYAGILVVATTVPQLRGGQVSVSYGQLAPALCGASSAGLTNPASLPSPVAAPVPASPFSSQPYATLNSL